MSKNDGGPAFPIHPDLSNFVGKHGMTLRDYFAANAMQAWIGTLAQENLDDLDGPDDEFFLEHTQAVANTAYAYADAMLKEREK